MSPEELPKEEPKKEPEIQTSKSYFEKMGLNPKVDKNTFTEKDAIAIMEKAISDIKRRKLQSDTVKAVVRQAWGIFKILA